MTIINIAVTLRISCYGIKMEFNTTTPEVCFVLEFGTLPIQEEKQLDVI